MNTTAWLIRYSVDGQQFETVCTHVAVADYRRIDPAATVVRIDCAAVAGLIARAEQSQAWVGKFIADRDGEPDVSGVSAHARRHVERMTAAIDACKGESA